MQHQEVTFIFTHRPQEVVHQQVVSYQSDKHCPWIIKFLVRTWDVTQLLSFHYLSFCSSLRNLYIFCTSLGAALPLTFSLFLLSIVQCLASPFFAYLRYPFPLFLPFPTLPLQPPLSCVPFHSSTILALSPTSFLPYATLGLTSLILFHLQ